MTVETTIEDARWLEAGLGALAGRACDAALAGLALDPGDFEISVLGADDPRIAALNGAFRDRERPTNVLSWPAEDLSGSDPGVRPTPPRPGTPDDPQPLGDIALAFETCRREAGAAGIGLADHTTHLLVHGTLHLLGFDHVFEQDAVLMEGLETKILVSLGIADPYRDQE